MVGDWVMCNDLKRQVAAIGETVGFLDCNNQVYWAYEGFDRIDYIPLTEEILVKNGFEKTKGGEYERTRYVMFSDKSWVALYTREAGGYSAFLNKIVVIHYVHQLQHLLRLCGIEKEIEL